jgi:hypothetical protein
MKQALRLALLVCLVAAGLLLSNVLTGRAQGRGERRREIFQGREVVENEVLVRFRGVAGQAAASQEVDADEDRPVGGGGWRKIHSRSRNVQTIIAALQRRDEVLEVEPNYIVQATAVPNDPQWGSLWGLPRIGAPAAWDVTTGSTANVIAVLDTGVDWTHPDLAANMWSAPTTFTVNVGGQNITCPAGSHGFNAITFSCSPWDDNSHGTHVSGTIGAVGNDGNGVAGVNWTTRIMALKFLNNQGNGSLSDALDAMEFAIRAKTYFAATHGADVRVFSASWGGGGAASTFVDGLNVAKAAEILFVAAAGNNASNNDVTPFYPASYTNDNVIAVASSDVNDNRAGYSNYGPQSVDLGAPGDNIYSTEPGGGWGWKSGTSMAAPQVSGAAMLVLSACNLNIANLKKALLASVDLVPGMAGLVATQGRLNVGRAITNCRTHPTITLTSPPGGSQYFVPAQIAFAADASSPNGIKQVDFYQGATLVGTSTGTPYGGTWTSVPVGNYSLTAVATDGLDSRTTSSAVAVSVAVPAVPSTTAVFQALDTTTQGNWQGVYGADGYAIANDASHLPSYVQLTTSGANAYTWSASTSDTRALQQTGISRLASCWYAANTFSVDVNLTDGQTHKVALYALDWDGIARIEQVEVVDAVTNVVLDSRVVSNFGSGQYLVWNVHGHVSLRVTKTTSVNSVVSGVFFGEAGSSVAPTATAAFQRLDTTTQGNWQGVYGGDGYVIANDTSALPSYAQLSISAGATYTWAQSTADPRALEKGEADGVASCWYASNTSTFDLNLSGTAVHTLAVYGLDWDNIARAEHIDVVDAATGIVLDSRSLTSFSSGHYLVWNVSGHILLRVTKVASVNSVISGIFLGAGGVPPPPVITTATFQQIDTTTQGNWIGVYGSEGRVIPNGATTLPAYAQVSVGSATPYTWSPSTAEQRALQLVGGGRAAQCWYSPDTFTIDLNFTDGNIHRVAIYGLDWDGIARGEQVDILNAGAGTVLDTRSLSGFSNGSYLVWNVQGHVVIRITRVSSVNAVLSALFIG